jgi:hypothetical protein
MMALLKDILTGIDGQSYALVKVMGLMLTLVYMGLSIAAFVTGKPFDGSAYGIGAAAVVAAMGAAMKLTENSEPKA